MSEVRSNPQGKTMIRKPSMIAETVCETGISKAQQKTSKTLVLAVMAGAYIGFGAQIATIVATDAAQYVGVGLSKVMVGVVFSVGLMLVLLAGAELFTGNNLIYVSYFCKRVSWAELLRNWAVVYLGNFLGSVLLVWIIFEAGLYTMNGNTLGLTAISIANGKVNLTFPSLPPGRSVQLAGVPGRVDGLLGRGHNGQAAELRLSNHGLCGVRVRAQRGQHVLRAHGDTPTRRSAPGGPVRPEPSEPDLGRFH